MRDLDLDPLAGACPPMLAKYPAASDLGRNLRRGDATLTLQRMSDAESSVINQERLHSEIGDRIQRLRAAHELNMEYLLQFGVTAVERHLFREVLQEVSANGDLTLREIADLAHSRCVRLIPDTIYR